MMARYPGAAQKPLSTKQTEPAMRAHDIICIHTMVGYLSSTYSMFKKDGFTGTESHFGVGGIWGGDKAAHYDGKVWQFQDTKYEADANLDGNWHVLSIETADNAPQNARDLAGFTDNQIASLIDLCVWLCKAYDIPPVMVPDSKQGRRGIAVHRQGIEHSDGVGSHPGWLVHGGERWSSKLGKECPGDKKIDQVRNIIVPAVKEILTGTEHPKPEPQQPEKDDHDMEWTTKVPLTGTDATWFGTNPATGKPYQKGDTVSFSDMVRYPTLARKINAAMIGVQGDIATVQTDLTGVQEGFDDMRQEIAALGAKIDQILSLVTENPTESTQNPNPPTP